MPAVAITSVNTTTEEITAVAHGLVTGDRFRLRNVGGALPAATPSLAGAIDYFAVRTGADTLKISDTNAHALAGTGIVNLTGSGSGTTTVEYGLPYSIPNLIAAPGVQVKSADLNGTWAALVALYDLLTGQAQAIWSAITLAGALSVGGHLKTSDPIQFSIGLVAARSPAVLDDSIGILALQLVTSTVNQCLPLSLPVGFVIAAWRVDLQKTSTSGTIHATLVDVNAAAGTGVPGTPQTNGASNPGHITLGQTGLALTVQAHHNFYIEVGGGGTTGDFVFGFEVTPG